MPKIIVYDIKKKAVANYKTLLDKKESIFYWDDKQFSKVGADDFVFFINIHAREILFAKIDQIGLRPVLSDEGEGQLEDRGKQYLFQVVNNFNDFIRFKILEIKSIPNDWIFKSLGQSETTYLSKESSGEGENRIQRIDALLNIFKSGSASKLLSSIRNDDTFSKISKQPRINFWWVCQGKSYTEHQGKKSLWAPKVTQGGTQRHYWSNVGRSRKGDVVFNYAKGALRGASIVSSDPYDYTNEAELVRPKNGICVDIHHYDLTPEIPLENIRDKYLDLKKALPEHGGPFNRTGGVNEGYLFEFNKQAAQIIRRLYGKPFPDEIEKHLDPDQNAGESMGNASIDLILRKKQIIFYGPPGTGKTYITKQCAVDLLTNKQ